MKPTTLAVATLCVIALPLNAFAERGGNGNGNRGNSASAQENRGGGNTNRGNTNRGNGNRNNVDSVLNRANGNSANALANPSQGFCPVGLRKTENGCVPPGQAAAGVTAEEWSEQRGYRYVAGQQLEADEFTLLPNYSDYDLPALPAGETYAVINRTAVVIDTATSTLLRVATR